MRKQEGALRKTEDSWLEKLIQLLYFEFKMHCLFCGSHIFTVSERRFYDEQN